MLKPLLLKQMLVFALVTATLPACTGTPENPGDGDGDGDGDDDDDDDDVAGDGDGDGDSGPITDAEVTLVCNHLVQGDFRFWFFVLMAGQRCEPNQPIWDSSLIEAQQGIDEIAAAQCAPGTYAHDEFKALLTGGRITFNRANLLACRTEGRAIVSSLTHAQYFESASTNPEEPDEVVTPFTIPSSCENALVPRGEPGDLCRYNFECKAPTLCRMTPTDFSFRCQNVIPVGGACVNSYGASCEDGAACVANGAAVDDENGSYTVARVGVCAPLAKLGESCATIDCVSGTTCDEETELCIDDDEEEEEEEDIELQIGDICATEPLDEEDESASLGRCVAACSVCRPEVPNATTSRCLPSGQAGAGCASDTHCLKGLFCDAGACKAALPAGSACINDDENADQSEKLCATGLICNRATGQCQIPSPELGPCGTSGDCATDLVCIDELCRTQRAIGQPCTSAEQCATGVCVNEVCVSGELGSACTYFGDCTAANSACQRDENADIGICVVLPAAGSPCIEGACVDSAFCNSSSICSPRAALGAFCNASQPCLAGLACAEEECVDAAPMIMSYGCGGCMGSDALPTFLFFGVMLCIPRARRRRAA